MDLVVKSKSDYKADENPIGFSFEGREYGVIEIEDRWYGPGYSYFKVFADDARRYILRQDLKTGSWDLTSH
jgi:hypothetical protein